MGEGRRLGKDTKGFLLEKTSTRNEAIVPLKTKMYSVGPGWLENNVPMVALGNSGRLPPKSSCANSALLAIETR